MTRGAKGSLSTGVQCYVRAAVLVTNVVNLYSVWRYSGSIPSRDSVPVVNLIECAKERSQCILNAVLL